MRVAFATLGCRQNQFETDLMADAFRADGYETVADVFTFTLRIPLTMVNFSTDQMRSIMDKKNNIRYTHSPIPTRPVPRPQDGHACPFMSQ